MMTNPPDSWSRASRRQRRRRVGGATAVDRARASATHLDIQFSYQFARMPPMPHGRLHVVLPARGPAGGRRIVNRLEGREELRATAVLRLCGHKPSGNKRQQAEQGGAVVKCAGLLRASRTRCTGSGGAGTSSASTREVTTWNRWPGGSAAHCSTRRRKRAVTDSPTSLGIMRSCGRTAASSRRVPESGQPQVHARQGRVGDRIRLGRGGSGAGRRCTGPTT